MNKIFDKIYEKAKNDASFRKAVIDAYNSTEPLLNFCTVCIQNGFEISIGDILTIGEEYSCNQLKSTNGGGVNPYNFFDDPFEMLINQIQLIPDVY